MFQEYDIRRVVEKVSSSGVELAQGNDNTTYTLTIPNANLEQTGTMVSVNVPTQSVQDIGGMYGPAENTAFSFYFDRTAPTARVNTEESGTWNPLLDNIIVKILFLTCRTNAYYGGGCPILVFLFSTFFIFKN